MLAGFPSMGIQASHAAAARTCTVTNALSRRRAALVSSTSPGTGVVFPFVFMALGWHAVDFASVCWR
jgi:hypothetical protein